MTERRNDPRQRVLKGGQIVLGDGQSTIDCQIRNQSPEGASLKVISVVGIPDQFTLTGDGPPRRCRVVWRKADAIGVHFEN